MGGDRRIIQLEVVVVKLDRKRAFTQSESDAEPSWLEELEGVDTLETLDTEETSTSSSGAEITGGSVAGGLLVTVATQG